MPRITAKKEAGFASFFADTELRYFTVVYLACHITTTLRFTCRSAAVDKLNALVHQPRRELETRCVAHVDTTFILLNDIYLAGILNAVPVSDHRHSRRLGIDDGLALDPERLLRKVHDPVVGERGAGERDRFRAGVLSVEGTIGKELDVLVGALGRRTERQYGPRIAFKNAVCA